MSREYPPRPILAVGGVVWRGDRVLLAQRANHPGRGTWTIPGGAVKTGESLREAVAREIREECGIEIVVGDLAEVIERVVPDEERGVRFHYVILDYVAEYQAGDLHAGSDSLDVRWVTVDELEGYSLTTAARDVIAKARRLRATRPRPCKTCESDGPAPSPGR